MNPQGISLSLACFLLALASVACRDAEPVTVARAEADPPISVHPMPRPEPEHELEILIVPQPRAPYPEDVPYATHLAVDAACTGEAASMAIAANHDPPAICESMSATPLAIFDGEANPVDIPVTWQVEDPTLVELDCRNTTCTVLGTRDIFENGGLIEPATLVTSCAVNTCPESADECTPLQCVTVLVSVALHLEGDWTFTGGEFESGETLHLSQTGRTLASMGSDISKAKVDGTTFSMTLGDYEYIGTVSSDRNTIEGDVLEQLSYTWVGPWSAMRSAP